MLLKDMLKLGQEKLNAKRQEESREKLGHIRGGSIGNITNGELFGKCLILHYLRMRGVEADVDLKTQVMFDAGIVNEDAVMHVLKEVEAEGYTFKCEEEFPVNKVLDNGTTVSGRPDAVAFKDNQMQFVIEMKNISSVFTMIDVVGKTKPKSDHLTQLGFYIKELSHQEGLEYIVPGKLLYTSGVKWHTPRFAGTFLKEFGKYPPLAEHNDKGEVKCTKPGRFCYEVKYDANGFMNYNPEGVESMRQVTLLHKDGYDAYINVLSSLTGESALPMAPSKLDVTGEKLNYNACTYCELAGPCKSGMLKNLQEMEDVARKVYEELKNT